MATSSEALPESSLTSLMVEEGRSSRRRALGFDVVGKLRNASYEE